VRQRRNGADAKFRAFSDVTRLRILHLLQDGELCVNDLVAIIDVPQPTASRHLAYLRKAELVTTRKDGQWIFYALAQAKNLFQRNLLACLSTCFEELPEIKKDAKRLARLKRTGGCCPT
jgi:ArsR family transcriptional regulator